MAIIDKVLPAPAQTVVIVRLIVCALVFIHGVYRALSGGYAPFGEWLTSQQVPFGPAVAIAVTAYEILAAPVLALGRFRRILSIGFILIYITGAIMVHLPNGWFVVGAGRNGVEYSVLVILLFWLAGWTRNDTPAN